MVTVEIEVSNEVYQALCELAEKQKISMDQLVTNILRDYIEKYERNLGNDK